jgi:hypothetical protein
MDSNQSEPTKPAAPSRVTETVLSPEELAIIRKRLATIDDAVSAAELFEELDDDLRARGVIP